MEVETGQSDSLSLPDASRFDTLVSARKPFGLDTKFKGKSAATPGSLRVHQNGGTGFAPRSAIKTGEHLVDEWKIFVGYAAPGTGNKDSYPHRILSTPFIAEPGSISSETYLAIGPFASEEQARNALTYLSCRLTRLLILLRKSSQHVTKRVYSFVPLQDWSRPWTDAELYSKYGVTEEEQAFIEKIVRPMEVEATGGDAHE